MPSYLLTWNASRGELDWARDQQAIFNENGLVAFTWACGNTKRIKEGDRIFFLRQRLEPRGIIGIGYVEQSPFIAPHWDEEREAKGDLALFIGAVWNYFSVEPVITRTRLDDFPYSSVHWNTQKSGISIKDSVADQLEIEMRGRIGLPQNKYPDETDSAYELIEGAKKRITVNAYERNPEARRKCIEIYGDNCSVCGMAFAEEYGDGFSGYIHVHHLTPVSEIGGSYVIDPENDLRPVCPNCHTIIHRAKPPFTIEQVKEMMKNKDKNA